MKRFLDVASALASSLLPKSKELKIDSYGQSRTDMTEAEIQSLMEWLVATMMEANYFGKAHLLFDDGSQDWTKISLTGFLRDEPVFLYRLGDGSSPAPEQCQWQLMPEHSSLRIYQLVAQEDD